MLAFCQRCQVTDIFVHANRGDAATARRGFDYLEFILSARDGLRVWLWLTAAGGSLDCLAKYPTLYGIHVEKAFIDPGRVAQQTGLPVSYNLTHTSTVLPDAEPVPLCLSNSRAGWEERLNFAKRIGAKAIVFPAWGPFLPGAEARLRTLGNIVPYFFYYHLDPRFEEVVRAD